MWPDWVIYYTLGNFLKPLATVNLPKSQTLFAIFQKVSKSIIFLVKSFLGNFYRHLATFFWSHWQQPKQEPIVVVVVERLRFILKCNRASKRARCQPIDLSSNKKSSCHFNSWSCGALTAGGWLASRSQRQRTYRIFLRWKTELTGSLAGWLMEAN